MSAKRINLSVPEPIFQKLQKEMKDFSYSSVQEVIISALREKFCIKQKLEIKMGRPAKFNEMKVIGKKKIFYKNGKAYEF